jgi:AcrR family transcriptional regulator
MATSVTPSAPPRRVLARVKGISSAAQQARRRQIMGVTLDLVLREGYDGLQMRRVAEVAKVSTRTLYKHFPSKEHLFLTAMVERGGVSDQFLGTRPAGRSPASRVRHTLATATEALQAAPALATGMAQALVCGQESVVPILIEFRDVMIDAIARAIRPVDPTKSDLAVARLLQRVWFTAVLAWSSGIEPFESVNHAMDEAIDLVLPHNSDRG